MALLFSSTATCHPRQSRLTRQMDLLLQVQLLLIAVSAAGATFLNTFQGSPGTVKKLTAGVCPQSCTPSEQIYYLPIGSSSTIVASYAGNYTAKQCQKFCIQADSLWGAMTYEGWTPPYVCYCVNGCDAGTLSSSQAPPQSSFKASGCPIPGVTGDPHFVGALGTRFDFNGELGNTYCLVTDKSFHINGLLEGYHSESVVGASISAKGKGVRSWIRELGILWKDASGKKHSLHLVPKRGKIPTGGRGFLAEIKVDGAGVAVPTSPGTVVKENGLTLALVGSRRRRGGVEETYLLTINDQAQVKIALLPASPSYQLPDESELHFNLAFPMLKATTQTHGILGQTYRNTAVQGLKALKYSSLAVLMGEPIKADGPSGQGFLDGTPSDYVSSSIVAPNCKFSMFQNA